MQAKVIDLNKELMSFEALQELLFQNVLKAFNSGDRFVEITGLSIEQKIDGDEIRTKKIVIKPADILNFEHVSFSFTAKYDRNYTTEFKNSYFQSRLENNQRQSLYNKNLITFSIPGIYSYDGKSTRSFVLPKDVPMLTDWIERTKAQLIRDHDFGG